LVVATGQHQEHPIRPIAMEQKPLTSGAITQWPDLCGCCQQCVPSCLCSFFCIPCFAPQVGSHSGWNPNWCGCHQNGPRPVSLCQKIFVKFIVVFVTIVITAGIGQGLRQANANYAVAQTADQQKTCLWAFPGTPNDETQCSDIGSPCKWSLGANSDGSNSGVYICQIPPATIELMESHYYASGYAGFFFYCVQFAFSIWMLVLLFFLRRYLHTIYPSGGDDCCMDCLCSFFCAPCALSQQARLVFKYEQNPKYATCSLSDPGPMDNSSLGSQQQNQQPYNGVTTATATHNGIPTATATVVATDY